MKILAIDAATQACSAALYDDGAVQQRFEVAPREHANLLLPMAHELLAQAEWRLPDLDVLAFGRGPGAFTGLRIAAGTAQGLAFGSALPVAPISDLAALAAGAYRVGNAGRVLTVADARMHEVYWCAFEMRGTDTEPHPVLAERVSAPGDLVETNYDNSWSPAGNGWSPYEAQLAPLAARVDGVPEVVYPSAADIARLGAIRAARGELVSAEEALPVYVRDDVARKPG